MFERLKMLYNYVIKCYKMSIGNSNNNNNNNDKKSRYFFSQAVRTFHSNETYQKSVNEKVGKGA